jgi:ubiquinone/menaquinone biosynthesis C-methylase UbiE
LFQHDSASLGFADNSYAGTLLFFLLHEQPEAVRRQTLAEALRVTAPGGRIVIADYHCPSRWHPLYYLFRPVLALLEPYALDLWRRDISNWLPEGVKVRVESHRTFFGGLYQLLVLVRE